VQVGNKQAYYEGAFCTLFHRMKSFDIQKGTYRADLAFLTCFSFILLKFKSTLLLVRRQTILT
jgi:hypothetical protein